MKWMIISRNKKMQIKCTITELSTKIYQLYYIYVMFKWNTNNENEKPLNSCNRKSLSLQQFSQTNERILKKQHKNVRKWKYDRLKAQTVYEL